MRYRSTIRIGAVLQRAAVLSIVIVEAVCECKSFLFIYLLVLVLKQESFASTGK